MPSSLTTTKSCGSRWPALGALHAFLKILHTLSSSIASRLKARIIARLFNRDSSCNSPPPQLVEACPPSRSTVWHLLRPWTLLACSRRPSYAPRSRDRSVFLDECLLARMRGGVPLFSRSIPMVDELNECFSSIVRPPYRESPSLSAPLVVRSEERRVGKECRYRWWAYQ